MPFDINISTELVCSSISVIGVIASALIAKSVSKNTAAKEIEKMKLAWEHEDMVSSEEEFGYMTASVARYSSNLRETDRRDALGRIASIRAKENEALATALDELYQAVSQQNTNSINSYLTKVINIKRSLRCNREQITRIQSKEE